MPQHRHCPPAAGEGTFQLGNEYGHVSSLIPGTHQYADEMDYKKSNTSADREKGRGAKRGKRDTESKAPQKIALYMKRTKNIKQCAYLNISNVFETNTETHNMTFDVRYRVRVLAIIYVCAAAVSQPLLLPVPVQPSKKKL
jgi:hypothetical protein